MFHLYEKFILEYYSKEYPKLKVSASEIPWSLDDDERNMLPKMQSDIMLSYGEKILIIDAKFWGHSTQFQHEKHTVHSNNLYQIFAYVKNKDASIGEELYEVAGMLLYAKTDETIQPDVEYRMSGNRISVKTLDLNCEFQVITKQLNAIVEEFFGGA